MRKRNCYFYYLEDENNCYFNSRVLHVFTKILDSITIEKKITKYMSELKLSFKKANDLEKKTPGWIFADLPLFGFIDGYLNVKGEYQSMITQIQDAGFAIEQEGTPLETQQKIPAQASMTKDVELKDKKEILNTHQEDLKKIHAELTLQERNQEVYNKKLKLLSEVPCGSEFSHCKFIKEIGRAHV